MDHSVSDLMRNLITPAVYWTVVNAACAIDRHSMMLQLVSDIEIGRTFWEDDQRISAAIAAQKVNPFPHVTGGIWFGAYNIRCQIGRHQKEDCEPSSPTMVQQPLNLASEP